MWTYSQSSGVMTNGTLSFTGYSGNGTDLNNPASEAKRDHGPIPRGLWRIGTWEVFHNQLGLRVAPLTPVGHNADGRSGFFIHGDNSLMNHTASDGCIIMIRAARDKIADSKDHDLTVTE